MSGMPWIKQHTSKLDDLRLLRLSDQARGDYFMLYLLAGKCNSNGLFIENGKELSIVDIAFKLRFDVERVKASLKELKNSNLIYINGRGPCITDWKAEQPRWIEKQKSDRQRQQRHRSVTRDTGVTDNGVTLLEEETQIKTQTLLLLSPAQREKLSRHEAWMLEAIELAKTKSKLRPDYIAGILKNWISEGRRQKGKSYAANDNRPGNTKRPNKHGPTAADSSPSTKALARRIIEQQRKAKADV